MRRIKLENFLLWTVILISLTIKLVLIFKYKNSLHLGSDDLNYVKSAVAFLKRGIFVFHNYNEPTVFVMPLYPFFLAAVFKIFGYGFAGIQAVRLIQAVLSCVMIYFVFLISKKLFNEKVGLITAFLVSFYPPNIVTPGYILTETLFTTLLYLLIYYSLEYASRPNALKFMLLGIIWTAAVLCRPTIALYPAFLFFYILVRFKAKLLDMAKLGLAMALPFLLIITPWWVRNYNEYKTFIPLAASSGNPMLQGTYVNYKQTPENIVYYKLGENAFETNRTEVSIAKERIKNEFKKDFWGYLKWFTIGKTKFFWGTVFYWKSFLGIGPQFVIRYHYFLLLGFAGIIIAFFKDFAGYILPISLILYFNAVHCIYMAFDRYAYPMMPILSMFCAYIIFEGTSTLKHYIISRGI